MCNKAAKNNKKYREKQEWTLEVTVVTFAANCTFQQLDPIQSQMEIVKTIDNQDLKNKIEKNIQQSFTIENNSKHEILKGVIMIEAKWQKLS